MNDKRIKQILDQLGSHAFPDATDPWTPIQTRLARRLSRPTIRALKVAIGIGLALFLLSAVLFLTPGGQVLAEAFRHLFRPATAQQFPTPSAGELATPTPAPTLAITLFPAIGTGATPTFLPAPTDPSQSSISVCGVDPYSYGCKIAKAEMRAGFDAKELPNDPEGFFFAEVAQADPAMIMLRYDVIGGGGYLYFTQGIGGKEFRSTNAAPESGIEEVQVGENRGEYVEGDWVIGGQYTTYTWLPCCRSRLRWTEGDRWYELDKEASLPSVDYMTRDFMIQMATHLVDQPVPAAGPRADYLTSLAEVSQVAKFKVLAPGVLPQGFNFSYGSYDKDLAQLKLNYVPDGGTGIVNLVIIETRLDKVSYNWKEFNGEKVDLNGSAAIYSAYVDETGGTLNWQTADLQITLWATGANFTKDQILEIGRSMIYN